jgi:Fe-S oxidoreductase
MTGEHGDGQARGDLLPKMFGERLVGAFGELKALFDPDDRMNPGKVVAPQPVDGQLRLGPLWRPRDDSDARFGYPDDDHSFNQAVMRCVGIGNCRSHEGGVMCPSYRATGEEEHSTRGRARLLFEMIGGHRDSPVTDGWRSTEVRDALDLCLACKGCKSDCPVGVGMATYKAEFLSHHYQGRLRPAAHYALGWLPVWARASRIAPGLVNTALRAPGISRPGKKLAGVADRDAPLFARESLVQWWRARGTPEPDPGDPRAVVLWPDTFSTYFHPSVARSAVRVLEDAGFRVVVPTEAVCCGLTWISTGQLDIAQRVLRRTVAVLRPWIEAGTPVVGLEPSCTAVFRADAPELMPDDEDVKRLAGQFLTFSELLLLQRAPRDWQPPVLTRAATVQTHCHQHAVTKFDADRELMRRAGIDADVLDEGCCGLAGNFGFEAGHHELSMRIGESGVLPAVRQTAPDALVLADGFSGRTQIEQGGTGRGALHLAEALALALDGPAPADRPEKAAARHGGDPAGHRRGGRGRSRHRVRVRHGAPPATVTGGHRRTRTHRLPQREEEPPCRSRCPTTFCNACGSGTSSMSSPTRATASTACSPRGGAPTTGRSSCSPGTRRCPRSRRSATPSSPARSGSARPRRAPARSTCSTACTTPNSTTCRWWPSSARPTAVRWAAVTSRKWIC